MSKVEGEVLNSIVRPTLLFCCCLIGVSLTVCSVSRAEDNRQLEPGYTLPVIDLAGQSDRQFIVDRQAGQYLGHPTTLLVNDGKSILCVYPKGHGKGAVVMKRSDDGGKTWSDRLPVPENWSTSKEVPTLHRMIDADGKERLVMFSGLYPIRRAISEDEGKTWSPLEKIGDFGGIVAMGCAERIGDGRYMALFHDDGRFIYNGKRKEADGHRFHVYKTVSEDGGLTWSDPVVIATHSKAHLCEPGIIRSPDGKQLAVLLRENSRTMNSFLILSEDEGETWSEPKQLPAALTGDRHTGVYTDDGRLFISFRDTTRKSETAGDWVAWVGTYDDIINGREGQYRVRLMDNHVRADCAYPGVLKLDDGTIVTTTYGHWTKGEAPYIVTVRLRMEELDQLAGTGNSDGDTSDQQVGQWNRFRGPNGNGVSNVQFPTQFQPSDFSWSQKLAGLGNGSPVIWGSRVFVQSADVDSAERFLQCLDLETGKEIWRKSFTGRKEKIHGWGSFASSTPAVDKDHVFFVWGDRRETTLYALDHDGTEIWHTTLGPSVFTHGYGSSPAVVGDQVVLFHSQQADQLPGGVQPGVSQIKSFSVKDGSESWSTDLKTTRVCYGVPAVYQQDGETILVAANTGNGVFAIDASDGRMLWELPVIPQRSVASPVLANNLVLASSGSGGGGNQTVAIDLASQKEVFRLRRNANYVPTLVVSDGLVFIPGDRGILSCLDLETGDVLGQRRLGPGAFAISSSLVKAGNAIYVISDTGMIKVLQANPELEELGECDLAESTRATPAISEDFLLFRTDSTIYALKKKD